MIRLLLAGESWASTATHAKGFDTFGSVTFHTGADRFVASLEGTEVAVTYMKAHEAAENFPLTREGLDEYDVLMLSDIGANTLLLHPEVWLRGNRVPNRLKLIEEWVRDGGGIVMVGGYLSFQGIDGRARWHKTPVERALPVTCLPFDDRHEIPEGAVPEVRDPDHPILAGVPDDWPYLLGFNEVALKATGGWSEQSIEHRLTRPVRPISTSNEKEPDRNVVLSVSDDGVSHPLLVTGSHGEGRSVAWMSDMSEHWLPAPFLAWKGYDQLFGNIVAWAAGRI